MTVTSSFPSEIRYMPALALAKLSHSAFSKKMEDIIACSTALDAAVPAGAQPWLVNPDTATQQEAKDSFDDAFATWTSGGKRGTSNAQIALKERRREAEQVFMKYVDYVASWARFRREFIIAAGVGLKRIKSPSGPTGVSTNLQQLLTKGRGKTLEPIAGGFVGLKFKRGANTKAFNIYQVDKEGGRVLIATGTRTRYVDLGGSFIRGQLVTVVVEGIGVEGASNPSAACTLTAL